MPPHTTAAPILWQDHPDPNAPAVLLLPGMGIRAAYYRPFTEQLARRGFHTATLELRGQGTRGRVPRHGTDHGLYELTAVDLPAALTAVHARHPNSPILLIGHSLGGHVATLYAATTADAVRGIVTIAADSPYHRAHGARGPLVLTATHTAALLARTLGYFPGDHQALGGLGRQPRTLMVEWAHLARSGRYAIRRLPAAETRAAAARLPLLAVSIEGDRIAPPTSVDHLAAKLPNANTQRWHYSRQASEADRLTHVNWVHRADGLADQISTWWAQSHRSGPTRPREPGSTWRRLFAVQLPDGSTARKENPT